MEYLFIAGCPRSGTSILTQLIGNNDRVVIGMERYGRFARPENFQMSPDLFTKERFFNVQPGDTFYNDFDAFHWWDSRIRAKFEMLQYVGDKIPELYLVYEKLFTVFPDATVVFIYRNVHDVAASWNKRAYIQKNWAECRNYRMAVAAWNESLRLTSDAVQGGANIIIVNYEDLFIHGLEIDSLYQKLGLSVDDQTRSERKKILDDSGKIGAERKKYQLSDEHKKYIASHAMQELVEEIKRLK